MRLQKQFQVQEGISCICNDFPWIGVLTDVDPENHDVLAKFLHPYFPSVLFHWHSKNDMCWVPDIHTLHYINPNNCNWKAV